MDRSQITLGSFLNGVTDMAIALQETRNNLFEATNVYTRTSGIYMVIV